MLKENYSSGRRGLSCRGQHRRRGQRKHRKALSSRRTLNPMYQAVVRHVLRGQKEKKNP